LLPEVPSHPLLFLLCVPAALPLLLLLLLPQVNQLGPTGCSSSIHLWALRHREDRSLKQQPLLAQLAVEQQQYPTPEALCAQVRPRLSLFELLVVTHEINVNQVGWLAGAACWCGNLSSKRSRSSA
jgi:hypothetical protein